MCKFSNYKIKLSNGSWSKQMYNTDVLFKRFDITTIKRFLIERKLIIIPCGKCKDCLDIKKNIYKRRVDSQLNLTKFSYLITITLNNEQQFSLLDSKEREYILCNTSLNFSQFTNLSKCAIDNIIKNWKNKLNRYYGDKVDFNYFLCGEYGANTKRAHYHCLLMLDRPLPNLQPLHIKGEHFKCSLIASKKFGLYDIQTTNGSINTASYITKYLNKPFTNNLTCNYNRFEEKQIKFMIDNNIYVWDKFLWPNKETLLRDIILFILLTNDNWYDYRYLIHNFVIYRNKRRYKDITNQKEFLKMSRKLGITNDMFYNLNHKVINNYYRSKYLFLYSQSFYLLLNHLIIYNKICYIWYEINKLILLFIYLMLCYQLLFKLLDLQRINGIKKYFHLNIIQPDKNKYKYLSWQNDDIF